MWDKIKELLGNLFLIWFGGWTIFLFSMIAIQGYVKGIEPNLWILYVELGLAIIGFRLGWERLIKDLIRFAKQSRDSHKAH